MNGYIFNFKEHGQFSPNGRVNVQDVAAHNRQLADQQIEAMKRGEPQALYLFPGMVGTWDKSYTWPIDHARESRNNFGATRIDCWFHACGHRWHGVNVGDNDIVRCKAIGGAK